MQRRVNRAGLEYGLKQNAKLLILATVEFSCIFTKLESVILSLQEAIETRKIK